MGVNKTKVVGLSAFVLLGIGTLAACRSGSGSVALGEVGPDEPTCFMAPLPIVSTQARAALVCRRVEADGSKDALTILYNGMLAALDQAPPVNVYVKINGVDRGAQLFPMHPVADARGGHELRLDHANAADLFRYARREDGRIVNAWDVELAFNRGDQWDSTWVDRDGAEWKNYRARFEQRSFAPDPVPSPSAYVTVCGSVKSYLRGGQPADGAPDRYFDGAVRDDAGVLLYAFTYRGDKAYDQARYCVHGQRSTHDPGRIEPVISIYPQ